MLARSSTEEKDIDDVKKDSTNEISSASAVSSIICYCVASIMMTLINKFIVSGANFSMTFLLLCIQSTVCVGCVALVRSLGLISFRAFNIEDAKAWLPISALLVSVIYTGSKSLQFLSIPVYTIFKNLTIILIAYGEVLWFGGKVSTLTLTSFLIMVVSSVIAAWSDVSVTPSPSSAANYNDGTMFDLQTMQAMAGRLGIGYFWMFCNCMVSAAYVLTMRKRIKGTGFSDWDSMFYNSLLTIPILAVFSFVVEDWGTENLSRNFPSETRGFLLFAIAFSGAAAVGISYTTAWCVRTTSSTTYSMVGALNKLPVAASGMLFFGDGVTFGSVSAIVIGFIAGVLYAVAKSSQRRDMTLPLSTKR
ncbi:hypothetical protein M378DRAFT_186393 [Amanita muscaria Koide BX008]|uniref:GDP-mannose transporter n=1 Tax=Amanita muscaria (strain Koide BX008) TaxID=946122 RepID=A0A0C2X9T6_AMAMK|nr:hypothetical protein M378DRAFT_186393 [Amanita muscaria Koide BX008]